MGFENDLSVVAKASKRIADAILEGCDDDEKRFLWEVSIPLVRDKCLHFVSVVNKDIADRDIEVWHHPYGGLLGFMDDGIQISTELQGFSWAIRLNHISKSDAERKLPELASGLTSLSDAVNKLLD